GKELFSATASAQLAFNFDSGATAATPAKTCTGSLLDLELTGDVTVSVATTLLYVEIGRQKLVSGTWKLDRETVATVQAQPTNSSGGYSYSYEPNVPFSSTAYRFIARPVALTANGLVFGNWSGELIVTYNTAVPSIADSWK